MHPSHSAPAPVRGARCHLRSAIATLVFIAASLAAGGAAATDRYELVGSATKAQHTLELTDWNFYEAGAIWGHHPMNLGRSFSVQFSFSLVAPHYVPPQADGIAMVIQTDGRHALGENGGGIGLQGLNGVASVIQTWVNNHVGFTLDGNPYDAPAAPADLGNASVISGEETVTWNRETQVLAMTGTLVVDGTPYAIADSRDVDLISLFGGTEAIIGFTGGTGGALSNQRIRSWTFQYLE
jgi:hypothetical protein